VLKPRNETARCLLCDTGLDESSREAFGRCHRRGGAAPRMPVFSRVAAVCRLFWRRAVCVARPFAAVANVRIPHSTNSGIGRERCMIRNTREEKFLKPTRR